MARTFILSIDVENDAFTADTTGELARILRELAETLNNDSGQIFARPQILRDWNGNTCGDCAIAER